MVLAIVLATCQIPEESSVDLSKDASDLNEQNQTTTSEAKTGNEANNTVILTEEELSFPANDSGNSDMVVLNATTVKKFTCLLDDDEQETAAFQVMITLYMSYQKSMFY